MLQELSSKNQPPPPAAGGIAPPSRSILGPIFSTFFNFKKMPNKDYSKQKKKRDALAEFGGRKAPKPQKTRKFHFFFPKPRHFGYCQPKKGDFWPSYPMFCHCVSDFSSQKMATRCSSCTFFIFFDFFETVGHLEGRQCAPPLPYTAGGRARHSRFWGNLGSKFFRSKIDFFQFRFR